MSLELVPCPECGSGAELVDEGFVDSTNGTVQMVRTVCIQRHWFLMAADALRDPGQARHATARVVEDTTDPQRA